MKEPDTTTLNSPPGTGSQCEVGLDTKGVVINEIIKGVRVKSRPQLWGFTWLTPPVTHWLMSNPHMPDLEDLLTLQRKTLMQ